MENENQSGNQERMDFESELADKEQLLGEEITVLGVDEERTGSMGGTYRVAHIKYNDDELDIAFGSILSKQWTEWAKVHPNDATPAKAMITKEKGKKYYAFKYIQK